MARCLVVADIHSNLAAFDAVLQDARCHGGFDELWVLGDIVGYGPDPAGCIGRVREHAHVCVAGNHDLGVVGSIEVSAFNSDAARACLWTRTVLDSGDIGFLEDLPLTMVRSGFLLVHGSPRAPVWEYVFSALQVKEVMRGVRDARHVLVGHTHSPSLFVVSEDGNAGSYRVEDGMVVALDAARLLINPGAVGQPRDGDPRAAYAVYDDATGSVSFHRVEYDVDAVDDAMRSHGLPAWLGSRLHVGH